MKKYAFIAFAAFAVVACSNSTEAPAVEETPAVTETATPETEVPAGAKVFFTNLKDGDVVESPVIVGFGVEGMTVEPAGQIVAGTGHHHIIINASAIPTGEPVPADETHIHYGKGQLGDTLDLAPGDYTLTMQFANGYHQSYGDQMSSTIHVTVK